jgi:hypothetical protein
MRFFLDSWFAPRHARALNELARPEHSFDHLHDKFSSEGKAEDWVAAIQKENGAILISGDHHGPRSAHECRAWRETGLTVFFLNEDWMSVPPLQQHTKLLLLLNKIVARAEESPSACGFTVSLRGKIQKVYS